jgi:hypothetical protein
MSIVPRKNLHHTLVKFSITITKKFRNSNEKM